MVISPSIFLHIKNNIIKCKIDYHKYVQTMRNLNDAMEGKKTWYSGKSRKAPGCWGFFYRFLCILPQRTVKAMEWKLRVPYLHTSYYLKRIKVRVEVSFLGSK